MSNLYCAVKFVSVIKHWELSFFSTTEVKNNWSVKLIPVIEALKSVFSVIHDPITNNIMEALSLQASTCMLIHVYIYIIELLGMYVV